MEILHGENIVFSRQKLTEKIKNFDGEVIWLEGKKIDLGELKQAVESGSLFGKKRLVVIENLFSTRSTKAILEAIKYLKNIEPKDLIIWEGKKIDGRRLTGFGKAQVYYFRLPSLLFRFLDSLSPKNKKNSYKLLHQCLEWEAPELIFYMLERQLRLLIIASDLGKKGLFNMADWQKAKLLRQADNFPLERLILQYRQLQKLEYQHKTGKTLLPLSSQLDLWLAAL